MLWDSAALPALRSRDHLWDDPDNYWSHLTAHTQHRSAPVVAVYEPALFWNATELVRRAGSLPIRVASKSIRVREVLESVLALPGFGGILSYTLEEALWLSATCGDVVVGYPTADKPAIRSLATDEVAAQRVTVMIDDVDQLDFIDAVLPPHRRENIRVCLDFDASLSWKNMLHIGVRRSPIHSPSQLGDLARTVVSRAGFSLVGVMSYEAQIAGVADHSAGRPLYSAAVRAMQRLSARELRKRRALAVAEVREVADLEFVNAGGTGSFESTIVDSSVTELTAGSGVFGSHLFDHYGAFQPAPALGFACDVVRVPTRDTVTLLGGGWIASGQSGRDRLPEPVWPTGLQLLPVEGAGEVQTPVQGSAAGMLSVGSRVWLRHAKAGESLEHTRTVSIVDEYGLVCDVPSYRGEGRCFL